MKKYVMGRCMQIVTSLHRATSRDYIARMMDDKIHCMAVAREYGELFWDGDRRYGYGGYHYDGRWANVAKKLIEYYQITNSSRILDVGCGKGYLLYEFFRLLPEASIKGFDTSQYALTHAKYEITEYLFHHDAGTRYPSPNKTFDLAVSLTTLHNLALPNLMVALTEIQRISSKSFIVVESFRNEKELFNLQCWALTCNSFYTPTEWEYLFVKAGYTGDYEFIFFE